MTDRADSIGGRLTPLPNQLPSVICVANIQCASCGRCFVSAPSFRGKRHKAIAEPSAQRHLEYWSVATASRARGPTKHGKNVLHILVREILADRNTFSPGERRRFSGQRIVMTRKAAASREHPLRGLEQQRNARSTDIRASVIPPPVWRSHRRPTRPLSACRAKFLEHADLRLIRPDRCAQSSGFSPSVSCAVRVGAVFEQHP